LHRRGKSGCFAAMMIFRGSTAPRRSTDERLRPAPARWVAAADGVSSMRVSRATASVIALLGVVAAVVSSSASVGTGASRVTDPPLLVPWTRVGDIALGEPRTRLEREYGGPGHGYHPDLGYYRLHGSRVFVYFRDSRVN